MGDNGNHDPSQAELISLERSLMGLQGHPHAVQESRRFAEASHEGKWCVFDHLHFPAKPVELEGVVESESEAQDVANILNCVMLIDSGMDVVNLYEDNLIIALGRLREPVRDEVLIFLADLAHRRAAVRAHHR